MSTSLSPDEREEIETLTETYNVESAGAIAGRLGLSPEKTPAIKQLLGEEPAGSEPVREDEGDDGADEDADTEATDEMVLAHYERLDDLYAELGTIDGNILAAGVTGRLGWYTDRKSTVVGWDREGRQSTLARDYDALIDNLEWVNNRSIHATIQYSRAERFAESWEPYKLSEDGREWRDGSPTLDYADIDAYAPFADIDLEDEYKEQRPDGELDTDLVEAALSEYIEAFAELAGGREHVYALDSVGGAYVMAAPTSTRPIAEHFADDREARERVFSELRERIDSWLGNVREVVNDAVPEVQGVFEPDQVNQKNRNYKAPLAVHKSLDGVVTPIDTEEPEYEFTHLSEADADLIDEAIEWAAEFTDEHDSAVESIVSTLWPDEYDATASWEDALTAWVDAEREAEREQQLRRQQELKEREHQSGDIDESVVGQDTTPYISDVFDAINRIDIESLVRDHCKEWEPEPEYGDSRDKHFDPGSSLWKDSDSGTSCYVYTPKNIFVDVGDRGGKGGPAKFMALKAEDDGIDYPDEDMSGEPFWTGVKELREEGYDIPVWTPDASEVDEDRMPLWSLREFALARGIVAEDDLKEQENTDGETYLGFKSRDYRRAILWAEEAGLDTGRLDHLD